MHSKFIFSHFPQHTSTKSFVKTIVRVQLSFFLSLSLNARDRNLADNWASETEKEFESLRDACDLKIMCTRTKLSKANSISSSSLYWKHFSSLNMITLFFITILIKLINYPWKLAMKIGATAKVFTHAWTIIKRCDNLKLIFISIWMHLNTSIMKWNFSLCRHAHSLGLNGFDDILVVNSERKSPKSLYAAWVMLFSITIDDFISYFIWAPHETNSGKKK